MLQVVETGVDSSSHYMHFINTVFTAQKMVQDLRIQFCQFYHRIINSIVLLLQNIKIDACVLGDDSVLLQQAVDLTGGLYVKVEQASGIAQVLNVSFFSQFTTSKSICKNWNNVYVFCRLSSFLTPINEPSL